MTSSGRARRMRRTKLIYRDDGVASLKKMIELKLELRHGGHSSVDKE